MTHVTIVVGGEPVPGLFHRLAFLTAFTKDGLASLVADVHTDGNTKTVLEEAVGNLDWVLVLKKAPDGTVTAAIGPAFTYYEFPHPMNDRLTDEAWRAMLASGGAPDGPGWAASLYE